MAFRDGPFENIKVPLVWTAAVTVVVAAIGCVLAVRKLIFEQRSLP